MKSRGQSVIYRPPFLAMRDLHLACHSYRPWIVILCWPQVNLSLLGKHLTVCFRSTFWWRPRGPEKTPECPMASEQTGAVLTTEPTCSLLFLSTLVLEDTSFSWIWAHILFAFEALQASFKVCLWVLSFWVRPGSAPGYYVLGISFWFWDQTVSTKTGWEATGPFLQEYRLLDWNSARFSAFSPSFGIQVVLWKLTEKPLVLAPPGPSCFLGPGWY